MQDMQVLTPEQIVFYKEKAKLAANSKGLDLVDSDVFLTPEGRVKVVSRFAPSSIERVRRVTGYFCKLSNCNEAKMQEISQRVKHTALGACGR